VTTMTYTKRRKQLAAERGDAGTFGTTAYMPFIFFIVLFGLFVALLGFWRQMTVMANERGAYTASTQLSGGAGDAEARSLFQSLTSGASQGVQGINSTQSGRCVTTDLKASTNIDIMFFGGLEGKVGASSQKRWERFYAGPADTGGGTCSE
jgi:hypothetical protein